MASGKRKKKNSSSRQIKKYNSVGCFITINAIKEENDKEKAKAKILAKAVAAVIAAAFKAGNIYENNV